MGRVARSDALLCLAALLLVQLAAPPCAAMGSSARLSDGEPVYVSEFRVRGNTVLPAEALSQALSRYAGRKMAVEQLVEARDALTALYVEHGYLTSGATIPDQVVRDGAVEIHVVEGTLAEVQVDGLEKLRPGYVRQRLLGRPGEVLNIARLENRLRNLQRDPVIDRINAHLEPGGTRGESRLRVVVEESSGLRLQASLANDVNPSLGGALARIRAGHVDLSGHGDALDGELQVGPGLVGFELDYGLPVSRRDTWLGLEYRHMWSRIVSQPFDRIDVKGQHYTLGATLAQPLHRGRRSSWLLGATFELRRSDTTIEGQRFSFFESQIADGGESHVSALRLYQEWSWRSPRTVLATRISANIGLDALDATRAGQRGVPDGRFVYGLAQLRFSRRIDSPVGDVQWIARANLQVSGDPLLPMERFVIGGSSTVRGYLENELVGDSGASGSLELRLPLLRDGLGHGRAFLSAFGDVGDVWNEGVDTTGGYIASVGLGLVVPLRGGTLIESYWGHRLKDIGRPEVEGLQASGVYIGVRYVAF